MTDKEQKKSVVHFSDERLLDELQQRKINLEAVIRNKESELKSAPSEHLRICDRKTFVEYYVRRNPQEKNGKYISKDRMDYVKSLAQKDYNQKVLNMAKRELVKNSDYISFLKDNQLTKIYDRFSEPRKQLVIPIKMSDDNYLNEWRKQSYEPMGFDDGLAEYYSDSGIRVRSKSEIIIANMLEKYGVPYKYECPLKLSKWGIVRPDFTCLNVRTRKEYIWEHFGMMDDENYANKNVMKINLYEESGYHAGKNMIMTFETSQHPINSHIIKTMIRSWLA